MKRRVLLVVIVLGLVVVASAFANAQNDTIQTATPTSSSVIQQDIFVRGGPGRDYLPVGKLVAGDRIHPVSRNQQGDWVMIIYGKGFGWIRRDLGFWIENVDRLPIIDVANLTPSPIALQTASNTPVLLPSPTPNGNWVRLDTDAQSGYVRAGPGRTYLRLGQLTSGDVVVPVSQISDGSWVMIRYADGFGWVSRNLVQWIDNVDLLPVIDINNLTPTPTYTATLTATATSTFTATVTPSSTPTATLTAALTATPTATPTATATLKPSATVTATSTPQPTATATSTPSATATITSTATMPPVTPTSTVTATDTATTAPTATLTYTLTATASMTPSASPTQVAVVPSATLVPPSATLTPTVTFTRTAVLIPPTYTAAPSLPTLTATTIVATITSTALPTRTFTATAVAPVQTEAAVTQQPAQTPTPVSSSGGGVGSEVVIAVVVLVAILIYVILYWRGLSGSERYAKGFEIQTCPVCKRGHLVVEARQERVVGIPRARHTVRCTDCRSVLRETGNHYWRYAVDPIENSDLYERFNGNVIHLSTLIELDHGTSPSQSRENPTQPPDFIDEDIE